MTDKLLNYSEKYNCIFVRIPRCATSSICKALDISGGHYTYSELQLMLPKTILKKAVIFTVARNPWDRVVSLFKFRISRGHDMISDLDKSNFKQIVLGQLSGLQDNLLGKEKLRMIDWLKRDVTVHDVFNYIDLQQFPYWSVGRPGRGRGVAVHVHCVINYDYLELAWKKYLPKILGVSNLPDLPKINTSQQIFDSNKENIKYEGKRGDDGMFPNYTKFYASQEEIDYVGNLFRTEVSWFNWKFGIIQEWVIYGGKKLPPPLGALEDVKEFKI